MRLRCFLSGPMKNTRRSSENFFWALLKCFPTPFWRASPCRRKSAPPCSTMTPPFFTPRSSLSTGDKPLFTLRSGRFFASGMPWCGKENWGCNKTVPLKAICFIDRAEQNSISRLEDNREIMSRLFLQLVMPEEHRLMVKYLDFANKLINTVPFYLLRCNMELSAAQTAHDGIFGIE